MSNCPVNFAQAINKLPEETPDDDVTDRPDDGCTDNESAGRKSRLMTVDLALFLGIGAIAGGFINGLAGFGLSLFALGWWLQVMPPVQAVGLVLLMSAVNGLQGGYLVRKSINWRRLFRFLIPAILGIPVGISLLDDIDAVSLKIGVAAILIGYGGFFAFRRNLPKITSPAHLVEIVIGGISGVLGALAGLAGSLPTMWCALRPWSKTEQRALLQPFNATVLGLSAILLFLDGGYDKDTLLRLAVVFPVTLLSAQVGIAVFKRLSDDQFRRLLIILMLTSGLILMFRTVF
jgi:uncharacterized membrane protein YfcA